MWIQHISNRMVHFHTHRMSSRRSCMDVSGSLVLFNPFPEHFGCGWSWPPCSPDMNTCDYFFRGYLKYRVYRTSLHTAHKLQAEMEAVAEEITGDTCDTVDNLWFVYSESTTSKDLILNMCSH